MTISEQYRQLNKHLHELGSYGRKGDKWAARVRELIGEYQPTTILDYGCGQGALGRALGIPIREYDPAIAGKDQPPEKADLVVCTDVLEHVEPAHLDAVLDDLKRVTGRCLFAVISTRPAKKTLADGRNAHQIVEEWTFWEERLSRRFRIEAHSANHKEVEVVLLAL
ncbi:hypothetical protein GCM10023264_08550 [Sphingomonas daechungensis]|uniref:class I SAM-dependent methyltransferase n=1 Tax=Sphingomonas daechungensis TaxID=1176646 RepID=UPI0031F06C72